MSHRGVVFVSRVLVSFVLPIVPIAVPAAHAALPDPISQQDLFAFPGADVNPADAVSAGLGLADRWLGTSAFENPAARPRRGVEVTPMLLRVNRQDLRARFHDYSETSAFVDGAGAELGASLGRWTAVAYAWQPVLRHEESAYSRGTPGGFPPPAVVSQSQEQRETRAGLALSLGGAAVRGGIAAEWFRREDHDLLDERSGVPEPGTHDATITASGVSPRAGAQAVVGGGGRHPVVVGAAISEVPAGDVDVHQTVTLSDFASDTSWTAHRGAHWDGGISARVAVTPEWGVLGAAGGASAYDWGMLAVTTGAGAMWALGAEYHDTTLPWSARIGFGEELTSGTPEPRASMVGIGLGWALEGFTIDFAALRRTLRRPAEPNSYDDHLLASLRAWF